MFRKMRRFKQELQQNEIEKFKTAFLIIRFDIEHITGKQSIELISK